MSKRGRPHNPPPEYVFVVLANSKVSYHLAAEPQDALRQELGTGWSHGKIVGQLKPGDYFTQEKEYQTYFSHIYEKGGDVE
jgi:hypothetical protein